MNCWRKVESYYTLLVQLPELPQVEATSVRDGSHGNGWGSAV